MAHTQQLVNPVGNVLIKFSQAYPGKGVPLTVSEVDITSTLTHLVAVEIDNRGNGAHDAYLRLWTANPATIATLTNLDFIFKAPMGTKLQYTINPKVPLQGSVLYGAITTEADLGIAVPDAPVNTVTANIMACT